MTAYKLRGLMSPLLSTAILAATAAYASAQGAPRVIGEVSGLTAYEFEDVDGVWLMTPDGDKIINGMVYDLSGETPVVNFGTANDAEIPEFLRRPAEPEPQAAAPAPTPMPPASGDIVSQALAGAEAGLAGVDDARKRELLVDLVSRMDSAKSPEEFQLLILEWQAEIQGDAEAAQSARDAIDGLDLGAAAPGATGQAPDRAAVDALAQGIAEAIPQTVMPTSPNPLVGQLAVQDEQAQASNEKPDDLYLLDLMRHDGFWFAVGEPQAPVVYAFIDPTCPYCARSIVNLKPELDNGSLQLRVLLAPAINKSAAPKIAAILTSQDPVEAFLTHELQYAERGSSSLRDVDFAELPPSMNEGIKANYDMILDNGLPGVPFFAYETLDGIKFLSGVPQPGQFSQALPDSYSGTTYTNQ